MNHKESAMLQYEENPLAIKLIEEDKIKYLVKKSKDTCLYDIIPDKLEVIYKNNNGKAVYNNCLLLLSSNNLSHLILMLKEPLSTYDKTTDIYLNTKDIELIK